MNAKSVSAAVMADIMAGLNTRRPVSPTAALPIDTLADIPSTEQSPCILSEKKEELALDELDNSMLQLSNYKIADFSGSEDLFFRRFVTTQVRFYIIT